MAQLIPVAELGKIRPGTTLSVAVADGEVALFNVDGMVYALDDCCVRCNAPLSKGSAQARAKPSPGGTSPPPSPCRTAAAARSPARSSSDAT